MDINVNKNSMVPVYYQIQDQIRKKIENEELIPGAKLPSERELSAKLNVSRVTIRKAMRGLIIEGLCSKRVGKGIFVSDEKITINLHNISGTSSFISKLGLELKTKLISKKIIKDNQKLNSKLNNEKGKILYIKRVRYINDDPLMLEHTYLPLNRFDDLLDEDFSNSLYSMLDEKYDIEPHYARGTFNVKMAKDEESKLLDIQLNTALVEKEVIVLDQNRLPMEYNKTCYRSDMFTFVINSEYSKD